MIYSGYRRNCRKNLKKSKKQLTFQKTNAILTKSVREKRQNIWDHSSAGRASALQAEGHRFEPYWSHTFSKIGCGGIAQLARAHGSYPWCRWFKSSSRYFCANVCGTSCLWQVCCISIYRNTARESEVSGSFFVVYFYISKYTRKAKSSIIHYM